MRGRKPKDAAFKLLTGNPGKRTIGPTDPKSGDEPFLRSDLEKPDWLDKYASEEWDRLVVRLKPILSESDAGMVLVAARTYSTIRTCEKVLRKGLTYRTKNQHGQIMIRQRPEVGILHQAITQYHRALAELGASPVSHGRVKALPKSNQTELPGIARLLG